MIDNRTKAYQLLEDWSQYKDLHYSSKTQFSNAVSIEIEKDAVARRAGYLREALMDNSLPLHELDYRSNSLETHLRILKDQITFELLKNGSKNIN